MSRTKRKTASSPAVLVQVLVQVLTHSSHSLLTVCHIIDQRKRADVTRAGMHRHAPASAGMQ